MARIPAVGDLAPDVETTGTDGPFRLSDHRGENVVLLFYPGDDTTVCTKQFCSYRDRADEVAGLPAKVYGVSGKDVGSKEAFAAKHGLTVPLLADPDGSVAAAFGMDSRIMGTKRGTVVIDVEGRIAYTHVYRTALTYKTVDDLAEILAGLPAPATSH